MATIIGNGGKNLIHRAGDGNVPPAGYSDVVGVTIFDDTITALGDNDIIFADAGNDTIDGGAGADAMTGGAGNDTYIVDNAGDTTVEGRDEGTFDQVMTSVSYTLGAGAFIERLATTSLAGPAAINLTGNDIGQELFGNAGANILDGRGGADAMVGGGGNDTYVVDSVGDTVAEGRDGGAVDQVIASVSYRLGASAFVERLTTSNVTGTGAIDLSGNDIAQEIVGNAGANRLDGRGGADRLVGGFGNDTFIVDNAGDVVVERREWGALDQVVSSVSYTLDPTAFIERLTTTDASGTAAIDLTGNDLGQVILGNGGANILDGHGGADTMTGGLGNDTYIVDNVGDTTVEGRDQGMIDQVLVGFSYTLDAAAFIERLTTTNVAGTAAIHLTGNDIAQKIVGNAGANLLDGRGGADTLVAGAGDDIYVVDNASDVIKENAGEGIDTVRSSVAWTSANEFENLTLTGAAAIDGTGNAAANAIVGNDGANRLDGLAGADTMTGGAGNDIFIVDNAGDVVVETSEGGGRDRVAASVSFALGAAASVETLATNDTAGLAAINLTGNDLGQVIIGNAGANILDGRGGADTMFGGGANDVYLVDSAQDIVGESVNQGTLDQVLASVSFGLDAAAFVERLTTTDVTGTEAINLIGSDIAQKIVGNAGANILDGRGGADAMVGGAGDDIYVVDNLGDTLKEFAGGGIDTVQTSLSWTLADEFENLKLTGGAALNGTGNAGNNVILGGAGDNRLDGLAGADTISGASGSDTYIVDNAGDVVVETSSGFDQVIASLSYALSAAALIERLSTSDAVGTAAINLTGSDIAQEIVGNAGANILDGGLGADSMIGGAGNDTYIVDRIGDVVVENGDQGLLDQILTKVSFTLGSSVFIERLSTADEAAISAINLTGSDLGQGIVGNAGANILVGRGGLDSVAGGAGNDTLRIDAAAEIVSGETYDGGADFDTLDGTAIVDTAADFSNVNLVNLEKVVGFYRGLTLTAEQLGGFSGGVRCGRIAISTGGGVDLSQTVVSLSEIDLSAAGNDITIGSLDNALVVNGNAGNDTVTVLGIEREAWLFGADGNDTLTLGAGGGLLKGGAGEDTLQGGSQSEGGAGADRFVYTGSIDRGSIVDFSGQMGGEQDKLVFENLLTGTFDYIERPFFSSTGNSEALFSELFKRLYVDVDGDGSEDISLNLGGITTGSQLVDADFVFS